jgi:hypothetical protein
MLGQIARVPCRSEIAYPHELRLPDDVNRGKKCCGVDARVTKAVNTATLPKFPSGKRRRFDDDMGAGEHGDQGRRRLARRREKQMTGAVIDCAGSVKVR